MFLSTVLMVVCEMTGAQADINNTNKQRMGKILLIILDSLSNRDPRPVQGWRKFPFFINESNLFGE
jgi:hypothetical protein